MIAEKLDGITSILNKRKVLKGIPAISRDGIGFLDLGVTLVRYRKAGIGKQTLVFFTDPPIVIEHYDYLISCLRQNYQVIVVEAPGFGFSLPSTSLKYDLISSVQVVEQILMQLLQTKATLIAPCGFGYVALEIAQKRPDLISHLVLSQVPSWQEMLKWKERRDPKHVLATPILGQLLLMALKRSRARAWLQTAMSNHSLLESFNELVQESFAQGAVFNLASSFQNLFTGRAPVTPSSDCPTLFVWGDGDASHWKCAKQSSLDMVPHADIFRIKDAGHFPELEATDEFLGPVLDFLHKH